MTDLLIDLGNTRLKWARSAPGTWLPGAAIHRDRGLAEVLDSVWTDFEKPERVVLASVATPDTTGLLELWIGERWGQHVQRVRTQRQQLGLTNTYREPETLGIDRWLALLGARELTDRDCAVVDCGTAVTIDALTSAGDFAGGVILPGLRLARQSLGSGTAGVGLRDGDESSCLARSTADGVAAGTLFGLAGAIERVLREYEQAISERLDIFLTGGDAAKLAPHLTPAVIEVPDLVLKGLARVAEAAE